jgi:hypothetical protein
MVAVLVSASGLAAAQDLAPHAELNSEQKRELGEGRQVVVTKDMAGQPWPQVTVYQYVDARPEEVAAVFFDYNTARDYIPNVMKSEISKVVSPLVQEVDYGVKIPILPDEYYTARNRLTALGGDCYTIDWKLLRAVQTKSSVGEFRTDPFGRGTIMRYKNLTTPGSKVAVLLRGKALSQIKETVAAIAGEVMRLKTNDPATLRARVTAMQAALNGKSKQ